MKRQHLFLSLVIPGVALVGNDLAAADDRAPPPGAARLQLRRGAVEGPRVEPGERRIERRVEVIAGPGGGHDMKFAWLGSALDGKPVKGAPFSATAVTEMEQTLADGNRIRQKTTAAVARDSAGRTRRELALGAVGPLVATANPHRLVHIHDPATEINVTLDPERKLAFRMKKGEGGPPLQARRRLSERPASGAAPVPVGRAAVFTHVDDDVTFEAPVPPGALGRMMGGPPLDIQVLDALPPDAPKPVREDLGTQSIDGVKAQGQRTTVTIPAGKIGNDRPLTTVSERWFSPDLGMVVLSRHTDPRFGTSTYRLADIDRREPPAAQFEVPADYKVEEGPVIIRKRITREDKPN
jgi:hypothetical protein